jgi:GT2 family glycosyltransferase
MLASAEVWDELEGLDERFFVYGEDVDFAFRAHQAGYRPLICPDAKLVHEVGESSSSKFNKMRLLYRGKATLVRKHWHGKGRSLGLFMLLFGTGLRAFLSVAKSKCSTSESESGWMNLWNERREWISGF